MGFNDQEIVALSGAHTDRSGYWGPWTRSPSTFSNDYFRLLFEEKWSIKKTHNGGPWTGPLQFESQDGSLMMLPSDMCCVNDEKFKKYAEMYKYDEELFFKDFSKAACKLFELGVNFKEPEKG